MIFRIIFTCGIELGGFRGGPLFWAAPCRFAQDVGYRQLRGIFVDAAPLLGLQLNIAVGIGMTCLRKSNLNHTEVVRIFRWRRVFVGLFDFRRNHRRWPYKWKDISFTFEFLGLRISGSTR